jgi:acetate kinase
MRVLALNPGSSTLKFRLFALAEEERDDRVLDSGTVDHVAGQTTARAAEGVTARCAPQGVEAVGCRVVHGGSRFVAPTPVDERVVEGIRELGELAPLHNPVAAAVLDACRRRLPGTPAVAVFDTAFHRTIPEVAALYALPLELSRRLGLRRYGFHGISYAYVSARLLDCLGRGPSGTRLVLCHLGNGASVCAVRDGRSVDTSMGLTPLEGLVMGTRCGDIDPGLLLHLLNARRMAPAELDDLLNHRSGLLGLGGHSDMRELEQSAAGGDASARLAIECFAYRARKYVGAYVAALGGLDALAFTAGIGEHSALVRRLVCEGLEGLGVRLDPALNERVQPGGPVRISAADSPAQVWVIPTDEEHQIAREAAGVVGGRGRGV